MEEIIASLKPCEVSVFEAFNSGSDKKSTMHGLLSVQPENWPARIASQFEAGGPDQNLLEKLRALPLFVQIKIDPDTLL